MGETHTSLDNPVWERPPGLDNTVWERPPGLDNTVWERPPGLDNPNRDSRMSRSHVANGTRGLSPLSPLSKNSELSVSSVAEKNNTVREPLFSGACECKCLSRECAHHGDEKKRVFSTRALPLISGRGIPAQERTLSLYNMKKPPGFWRF